MSERTVGTVARGLRTPIITEGDDIVEIVVNSVLAASRAEGFKIQDRDIVSVTESVVARAQGNYATVDDVARDVSSKFGTDTIGVVFPILSRNRFALILKGIARAAEKVVLMLHYPADEVGNSLVDPELMDEVKLNPWKDVLTEKDFRKHFGFTFHPFTNIDYIDFYKSILAENCKAFEIIFSNNPKTILKYTKSVIVADIHTRARTRKALLAAGAKKVYGLEDLLREPAGSVGWNEDYGLLGSNKATDERLKLFPRDCQRIVDDIQKRLKSETGKVVEVLVYGDGAFKDPQGGIWELADPVISPAFTPGLSGTPSEIKLKYLADKDFASLKGKELQDAIRGYLKSDKIASGSSEASQGTTPRQITDLLGSLSDLTSGSGDKGTPVVYIQGYFDNYAQ